MTPTLQHLNLLFQVTLKSLQLKFVHISPLNYHSFVYVSCSPSSVGLTDTVRDPSVCPSIWRIIRISWPMEDKPSLHTWTPAGKHLWCQRWRGGVWVQRLAGTSPQGRRSDLVKLLLKYNHSARKGALNIAVNNSRQPRSRAKAESWKGDVKTLKLFDEGSGRGNYTLGQEWRKMCRLTAATPLSHPALLWRCCVMRICLS